MLEIARGLSQAESKPALLSAQPYPTLPDPSRRRWGPEQVALTTPNRVYLPLPGSQAIDGLRVARISDRSSEKGTGPICAQRVLGRFGELDLSPFRRGGTRRWNNLVLRQG